MGEWETGLNVAHDRGVINAEMRDRLAAMEFERESPSEGFPMRIALIVLGAILLVSAGFAIFIRLVPDDPSQLLVAAMLLGVAAVAETIAWIVRRTNAVAFLAGIIGSFAGIPLGVALVLALPHQALAPRATCRRNIARLRRSEHVATNAKHLGRTVQAHRGEDPGRDGQGSCRLGRCQYARRRILRGR